MKKVYDPKQQCVILVDENAERDWMKKYWHCSGVPFENESEKSEANESKPVLTQEEMDAKVLKQLHKKYKLKYGKEVSARYKNDVEWIQNKVR